MFCDCFCDHLRHLQPNLPGTSYYAIRALQCAYSVCYPMTPWYGYMAEYYNGLVDTFCR